MYVCRALTIWIYSRYFVWSLFGPLWWCTEYLIADWIWFFGGLRKLGNHALLLAWRDSTPDRSLWWSFSVLVSVCVKHLNRCKTSSRGTLRTIRDHVQTKLPDCMGYRAWSALRTCSISLLCMASGQARNSPAVWSFRCYYMACTFAAIWHLTLFILCLGRQVPVPWSYVFGTLWSSFCSWSRLLDFILTIAYYFMQVYLGSIVMCGCMVGSTWCHGPIWGSPFLRMLTNGTLNSHISTC